MAEVADRLEQSDAYVHVDAAQSFARDIDALRHPRIDLISASAHKINGPKGIGALIMRRRGQERPPLQPLMFGGGQERGLRPGTMPVALAAGFGMAAELAAAEREVRGRPLCRVSRGAAGRLGAARRNRERGLNAIGPVHRQSVVSGTRSGRRDRRMERSRGHIERCRMHIADLHLQPRVECHGPARVEDGRRCAILLVCGDAGAGLECARGGAAALFRSIQKAAAT